MLLDRVSGQILEGLLDHVNLLVPGQVIQYKRSLFLRDRFVLSSGAGVCPLPW